MMKDKRMPEFELLCNCPSMNVSYKTSQCRWLLPYSDRLRLVSAIKDEERSFMLAFVLTYLLGVSSLLEKQLVFGVGAGRFFAYLKHWIRLEVWQHWSTKAARIKTRICLHWQVELPAPRLRRQRRGRRLALL